MRDSAGFPGMRIVGAGPAGGTAAVAACREGADVLIQEKSLFPRHKVCGEFLSPEVALIFDRLGILSSFASLQPWKIPDASITIGRRTKRWKLDEPAFGIRRYALDTFLLDCAQKAGARLIRETANNSGGPVVVASGRRHSVPAGRRLFGFKAHFEGPPSDSMDLYFHQQMYVGVNSVETGETNVCALASEPLLRNCNFEPDALIGGSGALAERLRPLTRRMEWLITGPLVYGARFDVSTAPDVYPAGDSLGFVDPFTGSGMLGAISTGYLAGRACAHGTPSDDYLRNCRQLLSGQYHAAGLFRKLLDWGWAESLSRMVPGHLLFDLTRPAVHRVVDPRPGLFA